MKRILQILTVALSLSFAVNTAQAQGLTTSNLSGTVRDQNGEPLPGATVVAVHGPTGSTFGVSTNTDGRFRLANINVGGPYKLTVSFVGYKNYEQTGLSLALGQTLNLNIDLQEEASELDAIEVTARRDDLFDGTRTGVQTIINERRINETPTVSRSIADFARLEPSVSLGEGNDGFSISINGQNNRYNTIYIDGAVNNDVFGLAGSGTNGGQTGAAPISIDAIEQFQVSVAPFDVRLSGFAGGAISAVTRSGSNNFEGSVYYLFRNENLAGKTPTENVTERERVKLNDFSASTYGVRVGGPIIKDKLFFFASAELQRDETPYPFDFSTYQGNATRADLDGLVSRLNQLGYEPGGFENNSGFLDVDRYLVRFDYNLNANHQIAARLSYTQADNRERFQSGTRFIAFQNGAESFLSTTISAALEVKSRFGNKFSNHFTLGYTNVDDDRDPTGDPFPYVLIDDGAGDIVFGSERFSTANLLQQEIFTITDNFEIAAGSHNILLGTNMEFYDVGNLFIRENYGSYRYNGIQSFIDDTFPGNTVTPSDYDRSFSLRDNIAGDGSSAIAAFNAGLIGFYVQDEWQVSDRFRLTYGVRMDIPFFEDTPANEDFNNNTVPLVEEFYDLRGARTGSFIKSNPLFAPRVGFNLDIKGDQTLQLRGGVGIFTSRVPLVWPGGAFNNWGLNVGGVGGPDFAPDVFNPDINTQPPGNIDPNSATPSGQIDLFAEDFKVPQVFKTDLALDIKLPWGMIGTAEVLYTKNLSSVAYKNVNIKPSVENLNGADNRPIYERFDRIDPTYGADIYLAYTTSIGYSYNLIAQIQKPFENGFTFTTAYSYGDAFSLFDGTSSQNSSQWRGLQTVNGRNIQTTAQRSNFSPGSRIISQVSYRKEYAGFGATQVSVIYEGNSGRPFSYIYNNNLTNENSTEASLIYVPRSFEESNFVDDGGITAFEQWTAFNRYVESDPYLRSRRGQYVERNGSRAPFNHVLDLRFLQEFYVELGSGQRNILQLSVDIFNFANLLNKDWGRIRTSGNVQLLNFEGFEDNGQGPNQPTFSYNQPTNNDDIFFERFDDAGFRSSRWQMQIGLRYIFQ